MRSDDDKAKNESDNESLVTRISGVGRIFTEGGPARKARAENFDDHAHLTRARLVQGGALDPRTLQLRCTQRQNVKR